MLGQVLGQFGPMLLPFYMHYIFVFLLTGFSLFATAVRSNADIHGRNVLLLSFSAVVQILTCRLREMSFRTHRGVSYPMRNIWKVDIRDNCHHSIIPIFFVSSIIGQCLLSAVFSSWAEIFQRASS